MSEGTTVTARIDKWLWEVRLYKTRSDAVHACKMGRIRINEIDVKPSRSIKIDEVIQVNLQPLLKTIKVIGFPKSRVGAKLVPDYYSDLTLESEYERVKLIRNTNIEYRNRGTGRPTKKERRYIDKLKDNW